MEYNPELTVLVLKFMKIEILQIPFVRHEATYKPILASLVPQLWDVS